MITVFMPGTYAFAASLTLAGIVFASFQWAKKKMKSDVRPIVIGAVTFFVFALLFENVFQQLMMTVVPDWNERITSSLFLYVLYGCAMAGFFEESGRYYAFTQVIPAYQSPETSLSYGVGHGGIELVLSGILALLVFTPESFTASDSLFWIFERSVALLGHIALSVIVFYGVRQHKKRYLLIAFLLHIIADIPIGIYKYGAITLRTCDTLFAASIVLCVLVAHWCFRHLDTQEYPMDLQKGKHGNGPPNNRIFSGQN
ncbi:MAG TPA: YhfC family glutamic-type intramembrane protease [Bacillota bacterium]|nr:YhfC family glutamic-type intramembrane protease [Bacillota bacterium]